MASSTIIKLDTETRLKLKKRILLDIKFHKLFCPHNFVHSVYYTNGDIFNKYTIPFPICLEARDTLMNSGAYQDSLIHSTPIDIERYLSNSMYFLKTNDLVSSSFGCEPTLVSSIYQPITCRYNTPKIMDVDLSDQPQFEKNFTLRNRDLCLTSKFWELKLTLLKTRKQPCPCRVPGYIIIKYFISSDRLMVRTTFDQIAGYKVNNFLRQVMYHLMIY